MTVLSQMISSSKKYKSCAKGCRNWSFIATRHSARIEVDTGPGGTIFRVRFNAGCKG